MRCAMKKRWIGISMPRLPRATIMSSDTARISSMLSRPFTVARQASHTRSSSTTPSNSRRPSNIVAGQSGGTYAVSKPTTSCYGASVPYPRGIRSRSRSARHTLAIMPSIPGVGALNPPCSISAQLAPASFRGMQRTICPISVFLAVKVVSACVRRIEGFLCLLKTIQGRLYVSRVFVRC
jgi:hypothetical protein